MLYGMSVTAWFLDPSLGPIIAPLLIAAFGAAMVLHHRRPARALRVADRRSDRDRPRSPRYFLLQPFLPLVRACGA